MFFSLYGYYKCGRKTSCKVYINKDKLHKSYQRYLEQLNLPREQFQAFSKVILKGWEERMLEVESKEVKLIKVLEELDKQKVRIEDLLVRGLLDEKAYKRKRGEVQKEITKGKVEIRDNSIGVLDVKGYLVSCEKVVCNLYKVWNSADIKGKARIQRLIFPKGFYYKDGIFATPKLSVILGVFMTQPNFFSILVAPRGIEPLPSD